MFYYTESARLFWISMAESYFVSSKFPLFYIIEISTNYLYLKFLVIKHSFLMSKFQVSLYTIESFLQSTKVNLISLSYYYSKFHFSSPSINELGPIGLRPGPESRKLVRDSPALLNRHKMVAYTLIFSSFLFYFSTYQDFSIYVGPTTKLKLI